MKTYIATARVSCPYCGSETCHHPSRLARVEFVEFLLGVLGRDVLHVYARRDGGSFVYDCPYCGSQHRHGGAYGSRATHCPVGLPTTVVLHPEEEA
jgi:DNA-directed RNA polymerase subunit RPC12/RpoP